MGWAVGYDSNWHRDIGYGVPAICDHPDCSEAIDRGLAYVCGSDPYGGEHGCGLYFCGEHLNGGKDIGDRYIALCGRCATRQDPFDAKPDVLEWMRFKRDDGSWGPWRIENPEEFSKMLAEIGRQMGATHG